MSGGPAARRRVAVVGAGITGLAAALAALDAGATVTVYEAADRVGGKLHTAPWAELPAVERGADAFLVRRPEAVALAERLGLTVTHPATAQAQLVVGGRLLRFPTGTVFGVPSSLRGLRPVVGGWGVLRAVRDLAPGGRATAPPGADRSVAQVLTGRLGSRVVQRLVDPLLGGVYAADSAVLSVQAALPGFADVTGSVIRHARRSRAAAGPGLPVLGSVSAAAPGGPPLGAAPCIAAPAAAAPPAATTTAPAATTTAPAATTTAPAASAAAAGAATGAAGGLGLLAERARAQVLARGGEVRLGTRVTAVTPTGTGWQVLSAPAPEGAGAAAPPAQGVAEPADAVILAAPGSVLRRLLSPVLPRAALPAWLATSVALVHLRYPAGTALPPGSGLLVAGGEPWRTKAVTFVGQKWGWPAAAPVVLRASVGTARDPGWLQQPDDAMAATVAAELRSLLDLPAAQDATVTRWGGGLPQYPVGHLGHVAALRAALPPGLHVAGAAVDGVGIPACVASGQRAGAAAATGAATATTTTAAATGAPTDTGAAATDSR